MIHNNFRKLMRLFARGGSSYKPFIKDFTDITGYTGINDGQNYSTGEKLFYGVTANNYSNIQNIGATYRSWDTIKELASSSGSNFYVLGGKSIIDEPDYTLGSVSNDLLISMISTFDTSLYNYVITGVLQNSGSESIIIDELALMTHCYYNTTNAWHSAYKYADFLLIKENLSAPITLAGGASISVTFSLFADEAEIVSVSENS